LTNPVYSGAYAFGRRSVEVKIQNGRKRTVLRRLRHWKDWKVLIKDHHESYISWEEFERNQRLLADNANRRSNMGRGSVRRGEALLAGLFRCARCGKKLQISYSGAPPKQRYVCPGPNDDTFGVKCISFGGLRSDRAVAQEVLDRLQPLGIEAALAAIDDYGKEQSAKRRQLENALEQARFEATRAHRQYDQVDPDNRLVAGELERRWNEKLANVRALEEQLAQQDGEPTTPTLSAEDRRRLLALGTDLPRAWDSAGTTVETRKRILRLLIDEIIVDAVDDKLELIVHWHGGDHSRLRVKRNKPGQNNWVTDAEIIELVRVLARRMRDEAIASILNRSGKSTGRGNSWTSARVASLRNHHKIAPHREGERAERGEVTIEEAAEALGVSPSTILRMINDQVLPAQHLCKGAPWIIHSDNLKREDVRADAKARRSRRPSSEDPRQRNLDF
jgi:excisionase family DNA binding protein